MATSKKGKEWCENLYLEGVRPNILSREVLVGDVITTVRSGNEFLANKRVNHAVRGADKILKTDVNLSLKKHGCNAVVLPRLLACSMWTRPAARKLTTLRNKLISTTIGRHRLLRCGENVSAILSDASREDPWGALIANTMLKTRRLLRKSDERRNKFIEDIAKLAEKAEAGSTKTPFPGPVYALVGALADVGVKLNVDKANQKLLVTPAFGPTVDILHPSAKVVKNGLEQWIRASIMKKFSEELQPPNPRRKDCEGLPILVDRRATLSLFKAKKSPIKGISLFFFRRILVSAISGSVRAGDRLRAAELIPSDACERDGCRHTTRHMWWDCTKHRGVRKEHTAYVQRVQAAADKCE